jgi:hypothetical protein
MLGERELIHFILQNLLPSGLIYKTSLAFSNIQDY